MSDFDRFFADKLEEEGDFPHRDRNWKQVSQRLDAFYMGGQIRPSRWHYWPAAAAVAVSLTVAGWLLWKMGALQQENAALRQEIMALRQPASGNAPAAILPAEKTPPTTVVETETPVAESSPTVSAPPLATSASRQPEKNAEAPIVAKHPTEIKNNLPGKKADHKPAKNKSVHSPESTPPIAVKNELKPSQSTTSPDLQKPDNSPTVAGGNEINPNKSSTSPNTQAPDSVSTLASGNEPQTLSPIENNSTLPADSLQAILPTATPDSTQTLLAEKQLQIVVPPTKLPDTVATAAVPVPLIKPARSTARFRIGVEGVAGMPLPRESGISLLTGTGIIASYSPLRSFRIIASADWLRFDVNTNQFVPKFQAPHGQPPMHPQGPHDELVQVESSQRQQHYALGLTYALPFHGWLRPAVRVAHTWVHVAPCLVSFRFEEHPHGGPNPGPDPHDSDYVSKKFDSQNISNIWRVGAGVEHELPRWTIGLWADYSRDFAAAESTFDSFMLRAGLQYKFD